MLPLVMTCGEPSGIGPELAVKARAALGGDLPFVWMGDARHLPPGTRWREVMSPAEAAEVPAAQLPILRHDFPAPALPGHARPAKTPRR